MAKAGEITHASRCTPSRASALQLLAAAAGWEETADQLGQDVLVDLNGYRHFVANEKKSCFVDSIDLYYSCDVTEQGIVLVDTPGADSVNARHTGVTFNYMKNADALIFVTYYNHAFSQGDRQFLNQLGRVKDSSAMDQMFFVVNAVTYLLRKKSWSRCWIMWEQSCEKRNSFPASLPGIQYAGDGR